MIASEQSEYIVQCVRDAGSMYEADARAFLAEHDGHVRTRALAEGAALIENAACDADWDRSADYCSGLRAGAELLLAKTGEKVTASAATAAPDFFQRGRAYRRDEDGIRTDPFVWVFEVRSVETHPDGTRYAFGFLTSKGGGNSPVPHSEWEGSWPDGWASSGWTDITEGGDRS